MAIDSRNKPSTPNNPYLFTYPDISAVLCLDARDSKLFSSSAADSCLTCTFKGLKFKLQYFSQLQPDTETPRVKDSILEFPPLFLLVYWCSFHFFNGKKDTNVHFVTSQRARITYVWSFSDKFTRVMLLHWRPGWKWNEDLKTIETPDL